MRADGVHGACVSRQVQSMSVIPVCRSAVAAQKKDDAPIVFSSSVLSGGECHSTIMPSPFISSSAFRCPSLST